MNRLKELNRADEEHAITLVAPLIERAPKIAKRVARHRPFHCPDDLLKVIRSELQGLGETERIELFRAHPELAPENPHAMTNESQSEQGRLNLTSDESEYRTRLSDLNARYREKFGFPFITALVRHRDINSVLSEFEARLASDRTSEIQQAIEEIAMVSWSRVQASFGSNDSCAAKDTPVNT